MKNQGAEGPASTSKSEKSLLEPRQEDGFEGGLPAGGSIEAGLERWAILPRNVLSGHLKG